MTMFTRVVLEALGCHFNCLHFLQIEQMLLNVNDEEPLQIEMRAQNYIWKGDQLYFRKMMVPEPKQNNNIVLEMHQEICHFGEQQTLVEICKRFYQHKCMEQVKEMVKACKECQMVKRIGNIRLDVEDLKNIPICDLFYIVALNIAKSFLETKRGNKCILVVIDHYSN